MFLFTNLKIPLPRAKIIAWSPRKSHLTHVQQISQLLATRTTYNLYVPSREVGLSIDLIHLADSCIFCY